MLFIINDSQLLDDCYIFNDNFYLCWNAKVTQIVFMNMKTMMFCSEFIQELFTKIWKLLPWFVN